MKKTIKLFGIIAMVAVIGFIMAACGNGGNGNNNNSGGIPSALIGKWYLATDSTTLAFEITSANLFYFANQIYDASVSGNTVILKRGDTTVGAFDYTISNNEMTITNGMALGTEISNLSPVVKGTTIIGTSVAFSNVTASGSPTNALTLTFSQAITGLSADDITLVGVFGVTKETLSGSGPVYTLNISGAFDSGTLTVTVAKSGYSFSPISRMVSVTGGGNPPPPPMTPDFILVDGKVSIPLAIPPALTIANNKELEIILDVPAVDESLLGCHFQGYLIYTTAAGDEYLLTGMETAYPRNIAKEPRRYRWTFKVGDFGTPENDDHTKDITHSTNGTIPAGAELIFQLVARTPGWKYFAASDAEAYTYIAAGKEQEGTEPINYRDPGIVAGIMCEVLFREKPAISWVAGATVATDPVYGDWSANGKGNIIGDEWKKLTDAEAAKPGSILRLDCTVDVAAKGQGGAKPEPEWGFGGIGNNIRKLRHNDVLPYMMLLIPKNLPAGVQNFVLDIFIEDIMLAYDPLEPDSKDWTFINLNSTVASEIKINSMRIYSP